MQPLSGKFINRRDFMVTGTLLGSALTGCVSPFAKGVKKAATPIVVSTWKTMGVRANLAAMEALDRGGVALDAVEAGVKVIEADESVSSVGYGGLPNADGVVQLDASIMDGRDMRCGGVAALENIVHPVSVARRVMEDTPHVLLVGPGALKFAREKGFEEQELLTAKSRAAWERWKEHQSKPDHPDSLDDHDTIGMIAMDANGDLAAAVTTSGLSYKLPGRVGDSPLIGSGIYADNEAGAAVSTGVGEEAIRSLGSFAVVEYMRRGANPVEAVMETLERVRKADHGRRGDFQLAFLAVARDGRVGGGALQKGFSYFLSDGSGAREAVEGEALIQSG